MQIDWTSVAFANVINVTNQTNYMTLVYPQAALEHLQESLRGP